MPSPLSAARLAVLLAAADEWTRREIEANERFYRADLHPVLAAANGSASGRVNERIMGRVLEDLGDVVNMGRALGLTRRSVARPPVTLRTLVDLAEQHTIREGGTGAQRGARSSREVRQLTSAQRSTAIGAAKAVAGMIAGDARRLEDVGAEHFGWATDAGQGGRGDWALVPRLAAHSDETARRAHERERPARRFDSRENGTRRLKQVSGLRVLLDLAATHGVIARRAPDGASEAVSAYAPTWQPALDRWAPILSAGRRPHAGRTIARGARTLALYATRRGSGAEAETDWARVVEAIEAAYDGGQGELSANNRQWARYAYNLLVEADEIHACRWPVPGDDRVTLVSKAMIRRAAETGDFSEWVTPLGRPAVGLTAGIFGLVDWWRWATARTPDAIAAAGLPPRKFARPDERQRMRAARKGAALFHLGEGSIQGRVSDFAWHAGWAAAHAGVDWETAGADALCDPEVVRRHGAHRDQLAGREIGSPDSLLSKAAFALATLAAPYLEARALQEADRANAAGERDRASALRDRADRLAAWAVDLRELALQRQAHASREDVEDMSRRDIERAWAVWSADGESGWLKARRIRDLMIVELEREAAHCIYDRQDGEGGVRFHRRSFGVDGVVALPIARQIELLRDEHALPWTERTFRPSERWATLGRDAVVWTVQHLVPLRPRTLVSMQRRHWVNTIPGRASAAEAMAPWCGTIHYEFSKREMKSERDFDALLLDHADRERPHAQAMARPDLLELFWTNGGCRDECLRLSDNADPVVLEALDERGRPMERTFGPGDVIPSEYVFPALARRPGSSGDPVRRLQAGCRWDEGSFSGQWTRRLEEFGPSVGLDVDSLRKMHGASSAHFARHLAGSHHCGDYPEALGLEAVSLLLHHKRTAITEAKYAARTARNTAVTRGRRDAKGPHVATERMPNAAQAATLAPQGGGYLDDLLRLERLRDVLDQEAFTRALAELHVRHEVAALPAQATQRLGRRGAAAAGKGGSQRTAAGFR